MVEIRKELLDLYQVSVDYLDWSRRFIEIDSPHYVLCRLCGDLTAEIRSVNSFIQFHEGEYKDADCYLEPVNEWISELRSYGPYPLIGYETLMDFMLELKSLIERIVNYKVIDE